MEKAPKGALLAFARAAAASDTDDCIDWPYGATGGSGDRAYGRVKYEGRYRQATHVVLALAGQRIPALGEHARHLCGNTLCVNPRHLAAGTPSENEADKVLHGRTNRGARNGNARLTADDVTAIRAEYAKGGVTLAELGKRYGVTFGAISDIIRRKNWAHLPPAA